ncbi:acetyl-hydrolase [Apiospora kogelbergensis]|uniref:acetyl-hydrolase n=1 Tax=Apiospora kogelbergensis TaxID=1337665 RepID=UPI00312E7010
MPLTTATVGMAVTPTVLSTFLSHYLNRKPLKQRPTAHLSYDEGLHLIRSFMAYASQHTVEELQAFTAQWVPHPQWVKVDEVKIPTEKIEEAAAAITSQLGPDGIRKVGGEKWWQWRKLESPLAAEWIEMKSDYNERKKSEAPCKRVMLYIHGGAYFFGSVDEHRYQMQRHARKLKARVFAPKYRLSPQYPFPCGLHDCLAAYMYLLTVQDPSTIVFAGDSAGGGMVMSLLVTLRDRGLPLPAGAILISPWVDLTHSFPSVAMEAPFDYIPQCGFHHKPSKAWPPLNPEEHALLKEQVAKQAKSTKSKKPTSAEMEKMTQDVGHLDNLKSQANGEAVGGSALPDDIDPPPPPYLSIEIDGKIIELKEQIQMYTTNSLLSHPLVSPVMQPSLGGLPPLLIMVGGGEVLRDEQIYLAHKCANPEKYAPRDELLDDAAREQLARFKPTDVQLQVWDDLCHVAPTLSFTRPAKFMYRSVAQFGAWALARAQKTEIDILDDDDISVITSSGSDSDGDKVPTKTEIDAGEASNGPAVGKAGDELPPFKHHMIRQRVSRHGGIRPLEPEADLPSCKVSVDDVGVIKEGPVRKWLETRGQWDNRFSSVKTKIHKQRLKELVAGFETFDGELPPPSALAGRRKVGDEYAARKRRKSVGLALWSLWGSKHDEATKNREQGADKTPDVKVATKDEGAGARSHSELKGQEEVTAVRKNLASSRSPSRHRVVRYNSQDSVDQEAVTALDSLMAKRTAVQQPGESENASGSRLLTPDFVPAATGATGKRPMVEGIAVPFSIHKEAETASMITLTSNMDNLSRVGSPRPMSPEMATPTSLVFRGGVSDEAQPRKSTSDYEFPRSLSPNVAVVDDMEEGEPVTAGTPQKANVGLGSTAAPVMDGDFATPLQEGRPPLETFVTAQEDLPKAQ